MKKSLFLSIFVCFLLPLAYSQNIVINEFMATNNTTIGDNYGELEDWIELYNNGSSNVNIGGMYLTDNLLSPLTYQIPAGNDSTIIAPGEYLLLWADGDTEQGILHIDIKLNGGGEQIGLYTSSGNIIDTITYDAQIANVSYGRLPNATGEWVFFGNYSPEQSNGNSHLAASVYAHAFPSSSNHTLGVNIYANLNWTVSTSETWLTINPSTGSNNGAFTVNVIEANSSATERTASISLAGTGIADQTIEIVQLGQQAAPNIVINEFLAENDNNLADNHNEYDDWIELYNPGNTPVDIGGMYLSDDLNDPLKFQVSTLHADSTTIPAKGFLLLWADDDTEQGVLHTNFKLSNGGEEIGLFLNQFTVLDSIIYTEQYADTSYGRLWDGSPAWTLFNMPTPDASNANAIEEETFPEYQMYPNPVADYLFVNITNQGGLLKIFDLSGRLLKTEDIASGLNKVYVGNMPKGILLIGLETDSQKHYQKVVNK